MSKQLTAEMDTTVHILNNHQTRPVLATILPTTKYGAEFWNGKCPECNVPYTFEEVPKERAVVFDKIEQAKRTFRPIEWVVKETGKSGEEINQLIAERAV